MDSRRLGGSHAKLNVTNNTNKPHQIMAEKKAHEAFVYGKLTHQATILSISNFKSHQHYAYVKVSQHSSPDP